MYKNWKSYLIEKVESDKIDLKVGGKIMGLKDFFTERKNSNDLKNLNKILDKAYTEKDMDEEMKLLLEADQLSNNLLDRSQKQFERKDNDFWAKANELDEIFERSENKMNHNIELNSMFSNEELEKEVDALIEAERKQKK